MYLGHSPTNAGSFVFLDDMDGLGYDGSSAYDQDFNGSITAFKMQVGGVDVTPKSASIIIAIDGVIQQSPSAYTVSASVLTFTGAPASTQEFYGILMGQSASVGAGTITTAEMAANSVDSDQYVNTSIDVEHLADNSIDEASLYADNSPTNDYALTAKSSATGGLTWAAVTDTNTVDMGDGFVMEDGDGTEVTITENKEMKFVEGAGIDINWTDTSSGTDGDPYDLTITCDLDASELAGSTLASGVTASSLTSVGVSLAVTTLTGNPITLDSGGDIVLDADGADVVFKDGGTAIGTFTNSSSDFVIAANVQDKDIIFKGNDNGSIVTALTFDMSDLGQANFSGNINMTSGHLFMGATKILYLDGGDNTYITESSGDVISFFTNGSSRVTIDDGGNTVLSTGHIAIAATNKIYLDGSASGNTYIAETSDNVIALVTGGAPSRYEFKADGFRFEEHLIPSGAGYRNGGDSSNYFGEVHCESVQTHSMGCFDDGVELLDGSMVSDLEAIKNIKAHSTKTVDTPAGKITMLDKQSFPKAVYQEPDLEKDEDGDWINEDSDGNIMKSVEPEGIDLVQLTSVMLGAIKELSAKVEALESA